MYKIQKWNKLIYFARDLSQPLAVYDFHLAKLNSYWFRRTQFRTMFLNLLASEQELLSSYSHGMRYDIKNGMELPFDVNYSEEEAIELFQKAAQAHPELVLHPQWFLAREKGKVFSTISHADYGCIAAHMHIYDEKEKIALLMINASDYRSYSEKKAQQLIGMANKYLFHRDFMYFKALGMEKYDLGGYSEATASFKRQFGGKIVDRYRYEPYIYYYARQLKKMIS